MIAANNTEHKEKREHLKSQESSRFNYLANSIGLGPT